jgi:hypothetical protein
MKLHYGSLPQKNAGVARLPKVRPLNSIGPIKSVSTLAGRGENRIAGSQIFSRFSQKGQNRDHPCLEKFIAKKFIRTRLLLLNEFTTFSAQSARKS